MTILKVTIPGQPVGKGRPRLTTRGGFARAFTPKKTRDWETEAAALIRAAPAPWNQPTDQPVRVLVEAVGKRPKTLLRKTDPEDRLWRPTKPDCDNVIKAAVDALVLAGFLQDDVQVVEVTGRSLYAAKGEEPHVGITVWSFDNSCVEVWRG